MAAAPDDFPAFYAAPEPFSPSLFLDLPPTPRPDTGGEDPASSDDLVLPFISRMLMEEDIDDKFFYQFPDHPALIAAAQQPYAEILSDATTSGDFATKATNSLSPSSSFEAPASADPVWPYDPVELSQVLSSPPYSSDTGVRLEDFAAADTDGFNQPPLSFSDFESAASGQSGAAIQSQMATTLPGADGDHAALASAFFGQNGVSMDMLNLAFLKGMEEASKFLPATNSLISAGLVKKEVVNGTPMFGGAGSSSNGRGRKNRHNKDDLESEAGRNSKVMLPDQEESGVGELFDEATSCSYEEFMKRMQDLRIAMNSESEKNIRKGSRKGTRGVKEVVDLRTMLIHCAQVVSTGDRQSAAEMLRNIRWHSSPTGDSTQRLAHCFAEGLEARLAGTGSQVYRSLMAKRTSVVEYLKAYKLYSAASCFMKVRFLFANLTIRNAMARRRKLHIVDYGIQYGLQWPGLIHLLAAREGGPPEVRLTGIDLPQPGFRPAYQIEETGRRLSNCARQFGVPFKFRGIAAKWETVRAEDLDIDPDEVLVVNSECGHFGNLMDEGVDLDSPSPRDMVLDNIREMRPHVFIQYVVNGSYGAPFFVTRFREALFFFSAHFDLLDATIPRDMHERLLIERDIFGPCVLNAIACEGADRVDRPETYKQCQTRNHRAGLRQLPLDPEVVKAVRDKVKSYHKDFLIDQDHRWLLQGWKGRVLYAMTTWVAEENVSCIT